MVYSRIEAPGRERAEALVSELEGGHAVLYASGLAALWAALVFYSPARIVMHAGYHGTLFAVCSQVPNLFLDCQSRTRVVQPDATTVLLTRVTQTCRWTFMPKNMVWTLYRTTLLGRCRQATCCG